MYFDTTYLARLYVNENGAAAVRRVAAGAKLVCSVIGRAEVYAAFHRMLREGRLIENEYNAAREQFARDNAAGAIKWLPVTDVRVDQVGALYAALPATVFLRAADALHLVCAKENGCTEIYSNDTHLLRAAPVLGLGAVNVI